MNTQDLHAVIEGLNSNQVDKLVLALDKASEIVSILSEKAVDALKRGPERLFVAERLHHLGSAAIPPLEKLLKESTDTEVNILASLVLLQLGSSLGVPLLLDAFMKDNTYPCLIARHLVRAHIDGIDDRIVTRLKSCELENVDLILCLLDLLKKLDRQLPSDLYERLITDAAPLQIRETLIDSNKA